MAEEEAFVSDYDDDGYDGRQYDDDQSEDQYDSLSSATYTESDSSTESESEAEERGVEEPPAKVARVEVDESGQNCPICFEAWTSAGAHRLVSLKCGHLFGRSCIERWLSPRDNRVCPTCKSRASVRDARIIYPTLVSYVDTSEVEAVRSQLEAVRRELAEKDGLVGTMSVRERAHIERIKRLENDVAELKRTGPDPGGPRPWRFGLEKNVQVIKESGCRVFAYSDAENCLFISQKSFNAIFYGYGIRKLNCDGYDLNNLIFLHTREIRALEYSSRNNLLLSASLDKSIRFVETDKPKEAMNIITDASLWSACWDCENSNRLYVGTAGGAVLHYDIRQTRSHLVKISSKEDLSPVTSLASVPGGVIACQLNSVRACRRRAGSEFDNRRLPLDGPFMSMSHDAASGHVVVSTRPNSAANHCRHSVCAVDVFDDTCDVVHTFKGSGKQTLMARTAQFTVAGEHMFAAHNEEHQTVNVWSVSRQTRVASLPNRESIFDIRPWTHTGDAFMATLSCNKAKVYKLFRDCI